MTDDTASEDLFAALSEARRIARETRCAICLSPGRVVRTNAGELVVRIEHGVRCPNDHRAPRRRR
jgi:hypothetical protein